MSPGRKQQTFRMLLIDHVEAMNRQPLGGHGLKAEEIRRQHSWARLTFGPTQRVRGIIAHIRKELDELIEAHEARLKARTADGPARSAAQAAELEEWADLLILVLDGSGRAGFEPEMLIAAYRAKLEVNRSRTWPDWRKTDPELPVEHIR